MLFNSVSAQSDPVLFCYQSYKINNTGMFVLGSWALLNMAGGAYGWARNDGQQKYFHQMNLFWNTVNLTIAGIALYNNFRVDCSLMDPDEIMSKHIKTERLLLLNSALDLGYIGTGFFLRYLSGQSENRGDLLKGYGNSLLLQGSFLLVFDLFLNQLLRNQRMNFINGLSLMISPEITGFQFVLNL